MKRNTLCQILFFLALTAFAPGILFAQNSIDPTFGTGGKYTLQKDLSAFTANPVMDSAGRIIVGGALNISSEDYYVDRSKAIVFRITSNGALDTTFGTNGVAEIDLDGIAGFIAVTLTDSGKILAAGYSSHIESYMENKLVIARFLANGDPDLKFGAEGTPGYIKTNIPIQVRDFSGYPYNIGLVSLQYDAFAVVVNKELPGGDTTTAVLGFKPGGSPDPNYPAGGYILGDQLGFGDRSVVKVSGSKFLILDSENLAMFNHSSGSLDETFGTAGIVSDPAKTSPGSFNYVSKALVLPDNRIYVVVNRMPISAQAGYDDEAAIVRLLPNGTRDPNFGSGGVSVLRFGTSTLYVPAKVKDQKLSGFTEVRQQSSVLPMYIQFDQYGGLDFSTPNNFKPVPAGLFSSFLFEGFSLPAPLATSDGKVITMGLEPLSPTKANLTFQRFTLF